MKTTISILAARSATAVVAGAVLLLSAAGPRPTFAQQPANEVQLSGATMMLWHPANGLWQEGSSGPQWQTNVQNFKNQWVWPGLSTGDDAGDSLFNDNKTNLLPSLQSKGVSKFIAESHVLAPYYYNNSLTQNLTGTVGSLPAVDFLTDSANHQWNYCDNEHGEDFTQAAVVSDFNAVLARASYEGFNEYYSDDFGWPNNGYYGYGTATITAFRTYLNGTDSGIVMNNGTQGTTTLHFWDYLALYTNVAITPTMAGCPSGWSAYTPVGWGDTSVNTFVFNALWHYANVKFLQQSGAYAAQLSPQVMLTPTVNNQSMPNGVDYYVMSRLNGIEKFGIEGIFGSPRGDSYHDNTYISENFQKYGHRISMIGEIGHGAGNHAYENWDSAYAHTYDMAAGLNPLDLNYQCYGGLVNWWHMATNDPYYPNYAAWAAGSLAFVQTKAEGATIPLAKSTVLVTDTGNGGTVENQFGPAGHGGWGYNDWKNTEDVTSTLNQLHYAFDRVGKPELANSIANAKVVVYCADQSATAQINALSNTSQTGWLDKGSGRYLILPYECPFATDAAILRPNGTTSNPMQALGLTFGSMTNRSLSVLGSPSASMDTVALTSVPTGSTVLLKDSTNTYPLITKIPHGANWILYVAVDYSNQGLDPVADANRIAFDQALATQVMNAACVQPEVSAPATKDVHLYAVPGGTSSVIWDDTDLQTKQEVATTDKYGNTLGGGGYFQRESVPASTIAFHVLPNTSYKLFDFYNNSTSTQTSNSAGLLTYTCSASVDIVYYGLANNTIFSGTLTAIQTTRNTLNYCLPNGGQQFMPSPAPLPSAIANGTLLTGTNFSNDPNGYGSPPYTCPSVDAFDGNLNTGFCASGLNSYTGIDLGNGNASVVTKISYYARKYGFEYRMTDGGVFEASNSQSGPYAPLAYVAYASGQGWTTLTIANPKAYRYLRYRNPNDFADVEEIQFYGYKPAPLTGSCFSNDYGYGAGPGGNPPSTNPPLLAYDGVWGPYTGFCSQSGGGAYAAIDLGQGNAATVYAVSYYPRGGFEYRMVGGHFQGSIDQSTWTDLCPAIATTPTAQQFTTVSFAESVPYRYLRWYQPVNFADVSEVQFYGNLNLPTLYNGLASGASISASQSVLSSNVRATLNNQTDGNVALYKLNPMTAYWSTQTWNNPVTNFIMQTDGNLVAYNSAGNWNSNTAGNAGATMEVLDTGDLVIYNTQGQVIWSTNTSF